MNNNNYSHRLSNNLIMDMHIRNLKNSFNKADNKEIDLNKIVHQQKQEMKFIELVRELEDMAEEMKQVKANFEQEKKQYFKDLEEYTRAEIEKAITNGLNNAFK